MRLATKAALVGLITLNLLGSAQGMTIPPRNELPDRGRPRPLVVVGFSQDAKLQAPLVRQIERSARYQVVVAGGRVPGPSLFVSGQRLRATKEHGWMNCRVKYFVAESPNGAIRVTDTLAASVPIMTTRIFSQRAERVQMAEDACLAELAQGMTERLMKMAGEAPIKDP